ncbi:MAG: PLP-dependent aminotransferase family protein [Bacillota bacterium]|jgi:DNA-binding transcriptional MocR family regulator
MFNDFHLEPRRPAYLQLKDYLKAAILKGVWQAGVRLPATRELAAILKVSRNTVIQAYQFLEDDGFIYTVKGQGAFVAEVAAAQSPNAGLQLDWDAQVNDYARQAVRYDIEKNELKWEKGMLSFKSIAPDPELFEVEEFKRAFLNRMALEGPKLLNYGYAKGYRNLCDYLAGYMRHKGVNPDGKEVLITNGFTEGLQLVLAALTRPGDRVVTENPTHNTALKIMRLAGLEIRGITLRHDGLDWEELEACLSRASVSCGFLIPSYHNPTGLVMTAQQRQVVLQIFSRYRVPVLEDGFNEELRYSGAHLAPLMALAGTGNQVIYLGSFAKILFPGLRIGWVMADRALIAYLESIKRSYNIHTSFLDQAVFFEYLQSGNFERYLKKARRVYKERHQAAVRLATEYIPAQRIWGEGGLHIFVELELRLEARAILAECYRRGVVFMPGDIFYTDGRGRNTFRLGISRVTPEQMAAGFQIIGAVINEFSRRKQ